MPPDEPVLVGAQSGRCVAWGTGRSGLQPALSSAWWIKQLLLAHYSKALQLLLAGSVMLLPLTRAVGVDATDVNRISPGRLFYL